MMSLKTSETDQIAEATSGFPGFYYFGGWWYHLLYAGEWEHGCGRWHDPGVECPK